jgi:hypothetical protein
LWLAAGAGQAEVLVSGVAGLRWGVTYSVQERVQPWVGRLAGAADDGGPAQELQGQGGEVDPGPPVGLAVVLDRGVAEDYLGGRVAGQGVQQGQVLPLDGHVRAMRHSPTLGEGGALGGAAARHGHGPAADWAEPQLGDLRVLPDGRVDETLVTGQGQDAVTPAYW